MICCRTSPHPGGSVGEEEEEEEEGDRSVSSLPEADPPFRDPFLSLTAIGSGDDFIFPKTPEAKFCTAARALS